MNKKILLLLYLIFISTSVFAESKDSSGIWITKHYVDDFGLPTGEAYISTEEKIKGTFSNTATTDDLLYVTLLLDDNVCFQLWEYGDRLVKGYYSKGHEYSIIVLAPDQTKTSMTGVMKNGWDRVILDAKYVPFFYDILNQNGSVSVLLKHNKSKYLFTIDDTSGIKEVYLNSFKKMPHHSVGSADEIDVKLDAVLTYSKERLDIKTFQYVFDADITTNLPDGIPLTISVGGTLGLKKPVYGSGEVRNGACKLRVIANTDFGLAQSVAVYYGYGTQISEEVAELYGDSLEKLTGEISDSLKKSNYMVRYSLQ